MTLNQHKNRNLRHNCLFTSKKIGKLINRIPGSCLLILSFQALLWERMLNRSASLMMSTSILKALPGKLDIKRHSPSILYVSASLAMSTCVLKALSGKLDIKSHSPSILYVSASLAMSACILKALSGKLDIERHSPSTFFISMIASKKSKPVNPLLSVW